MVKNGTLASPAMARANKRLARARRPDQKRAFRNLAAEALELVRVLEEVNDFHQVFLGLVDAGHIFKGHAALLFGKQLRLGLAKAHGLAGRPTAFAG